MKITCSQIQTLAPPKPQSYNPSKIQRGWDKLDSIAKYCIWMQPTEEYALGVRDILYKLRSMYITEHPPNTFDLYAAKERNAKWRALYERSIKNGRPL